LQITPECQTNEHYDATLDSCVTSISDCKQGEYYDVSESKCMSFVTTPVCPQSEYFNAIKQRCVSVSGDIATELDLSKLCDDETILARLDLATARALHCDLRVERPAYDYCVVNRFTAEPPVDTIRPDLSSGEKARCCLFNPNLPGCYDNPEVGGDYE